MSQPTPKLAINTTKYSKLSKEQAGHIRHFHNLVSRKYPTL